MRIAHAHGAGARIHAASAFPRARVASRSTSTNPSTHRGIRAPPVGRPSAKHRRTSADPTGVFVSLFHILSRLNGSGTRPNRSAVSPRARRANGAEQREVPLQQERDPTDPAPTPSRRRRRPRTRQTRDPPPSCRESCTFPGCTPRSGTRCCSNTLHRPACHNFRLERRRRSRTDRPTCMQPPGPPRTCSSQGCTGRFRTSPARSRRCMCRRGVRRSGSPRPPHPSARTSRSSGCNRAPPRSPRRPSTFRPRCTRRRRCKCPIGRGTPDPHRSPRRHRPDRRGGLTRIG